jgi:hypothetical protein
MNPNLDPELVAFLGTPDLTFPEESEVPDAMENFFENQRIDALCRESVADGLETRKTARFDGTEDDTLAKSETSFDRRKRNLSNWMRSEFALGKTAGELADPPSRWLSCSTHPGKHAGFPKSVQGDNITLERGSWHIARLCTAPCSKD